VPPQQMNPDGQANRGHSGKKPRRKETHSYDPLARAVAAILTPDS